MKHSIFNKYLLVTVILFGVSVTLRLIAFFQTEYANGWDAYFYLVQVKALVEEVSMHSPDNALVYPLLRLVYWICGDYVLSFKLVAAILSGTLTIVFFLLGRSWGKSFGLGVLLAAITIFSPHLTYFAAQFPKNLLGLILFGFLLHTWRWPITIPGLLTLILGFFGHKLTFGLSLIYVFLYLVFTSMPMKWIMISLIGVSIGLAAFLFSGGPELLKLGGRFDGLIADNLHWAPASFLQDFGSLVSPYWQIEIWVSVVLYGFISIAAAILYFLTEKEDPAIFSLLGLMTFLVLPIWTWSLTGFSYRFFLVFVLLAPLLLIFLRSISGKGIYFVALALIFLGVLSYKSYDPQRHDPPYELYHYISAKAAELLEEEEVELVIAHNSLAEVFTFTTGIDGMPWRPDYTINNEGLWRLATDVREQFLSHYLEKEAFSSVKIVTRSYFLVREDVWQSFLSAVREDDIELFEGLNTWKNPSRIRPAFLNGSKKAK
ncbi:MAG: hypothetical protein AAF502_20465 [Bacteroidota bacterium]